MWPNCGPAKSQSDAWAALPHPSVRHLTPKPSLLTDIVLANGEEKPTGRSNLSKTAWRMSSTRNPDRPGEYAFRALSAHRVHPCNGQRIFLPEPRNSAQKASGDGNSDDESFAGDSMQPAGAPQRRQLQIGTGYRTPIPVPTGLRLIAPPSPVRPKRLSPFGRLRQ